MIINTDLLQKTALSVRNQNNTIRDTFSSVYQAAQKMDTTWNGSASQNAMQAFYKLNQYASSRYSVLESLASAMVTLASGYSATEKTNRSLADRFK